MADSTSDSIKIQDRWSLQNGLPDPSKLQKPSVGIPVVAPSTPINPPSTRQDRWGQKSSLDTALDTHNRKIIERKVAVENKQKTKNNNEVPNIVVNAAIAEQDARSYVFPLQLISKTASESGPFMKISGYTYKRGFVKEEDKTKNFVIYLPIPLSISQEYSASLTNFDGSAIFDLGTEAGGAAGGSELTKAVLGGVGSLAAGSIKEIAGRFLQGTGSQTVMALQNSMKDVRNLTSAQVGYSLNPRYEVAFNSMGLRQHGFEFNLVPTSSTEADMIDDLVHALRLAAHPVRSDELLSVFYKYPDEFVISFHDANGDLLRSVPYIPDCIIANLGVTTSTGRLHSDNSPVATKLSIQFQEVVALSRDDIRNISGRN